jgi:hypothetical protein
MATLIFQSHQCFSLDESSDRLQSEVQQLILEQTNKLTLPSRHWVMYRIARQATRQVCLPYFLWNDFTTTTTINHLHNFEQRILLNFYAEYWIKLIKINVVLFQGFHLLAGKIFDSLSSKVMFCNHFICFHWNRINFSRCSYFITGRFRTFLLLVECTQMFLWSWELVKQAVQHSVVPRWEHH